MGNQLAELVQLCAALPRRCQRVTDSQSGTGFGKRRDTNPFKVGSETEAGQLAIDGLHTNQRSQ